MKTMRVSEFKAKCIAALHAVHADGESILVTHRGKPLACVEPAGAADVGRVLGSLQGTVEIRGDLFKTNMGGDWENGLAPVTKRLRRA